MFRLQLHEMLLVYAGIGVGVVALAVLLHSWIRARNDRAARRDLLKCGFCAFEFRDFSKTVLPRCPNCQGLVERRTRSPL